MSEIKFDPQTGEPVGGNAPKKSNTGKIIAIIAAAVVVLGGGAFAAKSLIGGGGAGGGTPYQQIKAASEKTFASDKVTDLFKTGAEATKDGVYAVDASVNVQGQNIKARLDVDKGNLSLDAGALGIGAKLFMDDSKVIVSADKLLGSPISYDYTADKDSLSDSYVVSTVGADSLKEVDSLLKILYKMGSTPKNQEEISAKLDEQMEELEYEEISEEKIKVGGKDVTCGGYSVTLTGEEMADLLDTASESVYGQSLTELMDELQKALPTDDSEGDVLQEIKDMGDLSLKFYISDGTLVQLQTVIDAENDDDDVDVTMTFAGEDIPWHDTQIVDNKGNETSYLKAHEDGGVMTYEIGGDNEVDGKVVIETETGNYTVYSGDEAVLKGSVITSDGTLTIKVTEASGDAVDLTVAILDDADLQEAPSNAKDVLTMSESELSSLASGITSALYGIE